MSKFYALKPCLIAGTNYIVNDEVDVSLLSNEEITNLLKRKFIVKAGEDEVSAVLSSTADAFTVPVITKDETITVEMTSEQLVNVVTLIQGTAEAAIEAIKDINEEAPLILIHRLDTRKSVQKAAEDRAKALSDSTAEPEPPKNPGDGEE